MSHRSVLFLASPGTSSACVADSLLLLAAALPAHRACTWKRPSPPPPLPPRSKQLGPDCARRPVPRLLPGDDTHIQHGAADTRVVLPFSGLQRCVVVLRGQLSAGRGHVRVWFLPCRAPQTVVKIYTSCLTPLCARCLVVEIVSFICACMGKCSAEDYSPEFTQNLKGLGRPRCMPSDAFHNEKRYWAPREQKGVFHTVRKFVHTAVGLPPAMRN